MKNENILKNENYKKYFKKYFPYAFWNLTEDEYSKIYEKIKSEIPKNRWIKYTTSLELYFSKDYYVKIWNDVVIEFRNIDDGLINSDGVNGINYEPFRNKKIRYCYKQKKLKKIIDDNKFNNFVKIIYRKEKIKNILNYDN